MRTQQKNRIAPGADNILESKEVINLDKEKTIFQSSSENTNDEKIPRKTKGEGDCAFHAVLGYWNPLTKQFEASDVNEKRDRVADRIRSCKQDSDMFPLIKEAIMALAMSGVNIPGEIYKNLREAYSYYERQDNDQIKNKWIEFEKEIQKHPSILEHIKQFIKKYIANKEFEESNLARLQTNFFEQFSTCENEGDENLRALIMSIPELEQAYLHYKKPNEEVSLNQWFNDENLLIEYANFISKSGQWLLPCELNIIAYVYNISIDFYAINTANYEPFNPGKSKPVSVCFNGYDHYQQMASDQEMKQFQRDSSSEAKHDSAHRSVVTDDSFDGKETLEAISEKGYLTKIQITSKHKNLHQGFSWPDQSDVCELSMLSVITGKNGIGKTVLLEAILMGFENRLSRQQFPIELSFNEDLHENDTPDIFSFSSSNGNGGTIRNTSEDSVKKHQSDIDGTFDDFKKYDLSDRYRCEYKLKYPNFKPIYDKIVAKFVERNELSIDMINNDYQIQFYNALKLEWEEYVGVHISTYGSLEKLPKYLLEDREINLHDLNQFLENKKFKYLISEKSLKLQGEEKRKFDRLVLKEKNNVDTIDHGWLSPGERLQLLMLLWIYASRVINGSDIGAVFILDEFDAHLHPSLAREIIEVIKTKLVFEYRVQVIMTTHNPTTVSLVPKECLYVMSHNDVENKVEIKRAVSKKQAIQLLTSDFVCVNEPIRIVFVEADNDKKFYDGLQKHLITYDLINSEYQLIFESHGRLKKDSITVEESKSKEIREDSSRTQVERLVSKLVEGEDQDKSLRNFIFGLVDGDAKGKSKLLNVESLERYAIENYIFDPVHIFFAFKEKKINDEPFHTIQENIVKLIQGDGLIIPDSFSALLKIKNKGMIFQHIINVFAEFYFGVLDRMIKNKQKNDIIKRLKEDRFKLINNKDELVKDTKIEKFVGDFELHYPIIFLKMRGHDIEEVYKEIFLAQKVQLSITLMINFCKEMMLIPLDLVQTLKNIQEYDSQRTKLIKSKKKVKGNKTAEERLDGQARALTERDEKIKRQKQTITKQQGEIIALKEQIKKLESKSSPEESASEEILQAPSTRAPKASFYVEKVNREVTENSILYYSVISSYNNN